MTDSRLWTTLALHVRASPGKAGLLGLLTLALLVLVIYQFSRAPRPAAAAPPPGTAPPNARAPGPNPDARMPPGREHAAGPVRRPRRPLPDLPDRSARDLFEVDWSLFARAVRNDLGSGALPPAEKAGSTETAPVLTLELTLTAPNCGRRSCAVINGSSVRVGDVVGGFVVESISAGEVVLSAEGEKPIVLRMN